MSSRTFRSGRGLLRAAVCLAGIAPIAGCQDGPMYALKKVNPYFVYKEWREDEAYGVTDHERREQLQSLAGTIGQLPAERQEYWGTHLQALMSQDPSPEMRRIAVLAAGNMTAGNPQPIIDQALEDEIAKVRMEACRSLAKRDDDSAARALAEVIGSETDPDVKHAAIAAIGNHRSPVATESLQLALRDRNPATRDLAVRSLKGATGKDYGDDPQVWIAALNGEQVEERPDGFTEKLRGMF